MKYPNDVWLQRKQNELRMKNKRRYHFKREIRRLENRGFEVREVGPDQYRINDMLDVFPLTRSFRNLLTGERGQLTNIELSSFIIKTFTHGSRK